MFSLPSAVLLTGGCMDNNPTPRLRMQAAENREDLSIFHPQQWLRVAAKMLLIDIEQPSTQVDR